jgi:hypothetical protein
MFDTSERELDKSGGKAYRGKAVNYSEDYHLFNERMLSAVRHECYHRHHYELRDGFDSNLIKRNGQNFNVMMVQWW